MKPTADTPGLRAAVFANLPNILTLLRIGAIPLLVWLMRDPSARASFVTFTVYLLASLTDFLDGYLARRYALVTPLGKLLDPLADKLLVVSALIMLAMVDRRPGIPDWLLVIIVGRELGVTGLRSIAASEGIVLAAEMILQTVGIHALILHYTYFGVSFYLIGIVTLVVATMVGLWSAVGYHVTVFRAIARSRTS
jgi:CDP-diacylglycerol--glycerol-3-phosphate 3-phosphatidyltransferase